MCRKYYMISKNFSNVLALIIATLLQVLYLKVKIITKLFQSHNLENINNYNKLSLVLPVELAKLITHEVIILA